MIPPPERVIKTSKILNTTKTITLINMILTRPLSSLLHAFLKSSIIKLIKYSSKTGHSPGKKVIEGFKFGLKQLDENYDIICKFDGDVIFPINYFDQRYKNGFGIVIDDVVAGIITLLILIPLSLLLF